MSEEGTRAGIIEIVNNEEPVKEATIEEEVKEEVEE